jgi:hypothetical protein
MNGGNAVSNVTELQVAELPTRLDFEELVKHANAGDRSALTKLQCLLDERPEIWRAVGDLGQHAKLSLIRLIAAGDQLVMESVRRSADELERHLAGDSPSPLELLCARRVAACWLELQVVNCKHPQPDGENLRQQKFILELKESADRRFHFAVKSLALVQRLLPPVRESGRMSATQPRSCSSCNGQGCPPELASDHGGRNGTTANGKKPRGSKRSQAAGVPVNRLKCFLGERDQELVPVGGG